MSKVTMVQLTRGTGTHKWKVKLDDGKVVQFGSKGYTDFTKGASEQQKKDYLMRHKATENWHDPHTAGFWSRWLLWNKPTIKGSLNDIKKKIKG